MDDITSMVVGPPHEIGSWRGPESSPWIRRIAHGAGFGNQWDLNREADEVVSRRESQPPVVADAQMVTQGDEQPPATSLRMWWLPSATDR